MFKRILLTAAVLVATTASSMAATGWTTGAVNFRDGPGAYYAKIGSIARCASVQLDYVQNGWYRVQWNGRWGWVAQRYITDSAGYCSGGGYTKHSGSYSKPSSGGY